MAKKKDPVMRAFTTGTVDESKAGLKKISQAGSLMHQQMVSLSKSGAKKTLANVNTERNRQNISHGYRAEQLLQGMRQIDKEEKERKRREQRNAAAVHGGRRA